MKRTKKPDWHKELESEINELESNLRRTLIIEEPSDEPFTVLTNDPSLTAWGWAILNRDGRVMQTGCIKTKPEQKKRRIRKGDDTMRRINEINGVLKKLVEGYHINYILAELPHGSQNASAARMIGMVAGVLQTISDWTDIPIDWYSEGDAKKALLGKLSATKKEIQDAISEKYIVKWTGIKYKDEAVADALAIHYVASQQSSILKFWK